MSTTVAATLDSVWRLQVEVLGYAAPPSDGGMDGEEYDVYIRELGTCTGLWLCPPGAGWPHHPQLPRN